MGPDHIKRTIPHRFEGGNGEAEVYSTNDRNEMAILRSSRVARRIPDEEPKEDEREEAATPAQPEAAEEVPQVASQVYTREEVISGLKDKHYFRDLLPLAEDYGVSKTNEAGKAQKKTVLVGLLADAYISRRDVAEGAQ